MGLHLGKTGAQLLSGGVRVSRRGTGCLALRVHFFALECHVFDFFRSWARLGLFLALLDYLW